MTCTCPSGDGSLRPCPEHQATHRLDNVLQQGKPRYGCHNEPRPSNGAPVQHNHNGAVIAQTVWNGSDAGHDVPCMYQRDHQHDELCKGCEHKERYRPSGTMCQGCVTALLQNCSGLPFHTMPVMKTDKDGTKVVRCTKFIAYPPKPR